MRQQEGTFLLISITTFQDNMKNFFLIRNSSEFVFIINQMMDFFHILQIKLHKHKCTSLPQQLAAHVSKGLGQKREAEKIIGLPPPSQSLATDIINTGLVGGPGDKICCLDKKMTSNILSPLYTCMQIELVALSNVMKPCNKSRQSHSFIKSQCVTITLITEHVGPN